MVKVYAPASIGNVSVGFDVLGAAVSPMDGTLLGDCVSVTDAEIFSLHCAERFVDKLPAEPEQNIVYQCWQRFCEAVGKTVPVAMRLKKNMPIGSGLGSCACSVVATLVVMNAHCGRPLNDDQMLMLMGEMEGRISGGVHFDNVASCFLGGMQLMLEENGISQSLPEFDDWLWVMAYPGIKVSTVEVRAILPAQYRRQDCISHGRYMAGFVHACHTRQPALAAKLIKDVIAEPYRTRLLPGFADARQAVGDIGALACGISGSGADAFCYMRSPGYRGARRRLADAALPAKRRRFCSYLPPGYLRRPYNDELNDETLQYQGTQRAGQLRPSDQARPWQSVGAFFSHGTARIRPDRDRRVAGNGFR